MMKREKLVKGTTGMVRQVTAGSVALEVITILLAFIAFIPVLWMAVVSLIKDQGKNGKVVVKFLCLKGCQIMGIEGAGMLSDLILTATS